jgi:hypothetical protein
MAAPQNGSNPRKHLPQLERLDDVVVGTELETNDTVDRIALSRNHDDRHIATSANFARESKTILSTERQIERNEVDAMPGNSGSKTGAIRCLENGIAFSLEAPAQQRADFRLIVDNENLGLGARHLSARPSKVPRCEQSIAQDGRLSTRRVCYSAARIGGHFRQARSRRAEPITFCYILFLERQTDVAQF